MRFHLPNRLVLRFAIYLIAALCLAVVLIEHSNALVERSAQGRIYFDTKAVPYRKVAVVLGCSEKLANGRDNLYFRHRIATAGELVKAKKCDYVIVSGDNSSTTYDEPTTMRKALIAQGVPEERIVLDYAGFRTLDSVLRAEVVFGLKEFTIVSQEFHNQRACYIAEQLGLNVNGICAEDVSSFGGLKTRLRERLARFKTVLELHVLGTQPKYTGPREKTPWNS